MLAESAWALTRALCWTRTRRDRSIAAVSFLATEAQFTPKAVETRSERDKLMFRVKVRIDSTLLRSHEAAVRTGLPGMAYVRLDSTVAWPRALQALR